MKRKLLELLGFPLGKVEAELQEAQYDIITIELLLVEYKKKLNSLQQTLRDL